jgi:hypothetical protein
MRSVDEDEGPFAEAYDLIHKRLDHNAAARRKLSHPLLFSSTCGLDR